MPPAAQFHLIVAANNANETRFAKDLGSPLPSRITVETLERTRAHNVLIPLLQQGRLEPLLLELVVP